MSFPDPQALQQAEALETLIRQIPTIPAADAAAFLRAEVQRRARSLDTFIANAPDPEQIALQLTEVDVERVIQLVGTTQPALHLIAAAIVELGATARTIADAVQWMELRPVGLAGTQQHQGIDIAYIIAYQALTHEQRWLLHTLAVWAEAPATLSREFALTVAEHSGALLDILLTEEDLERLVALALVDRADLAAEVGDVVRSPSTFQRVRMEPYLRSIASSGLTTWKMPAPLPQEAASSTAAELVVSVFTNWAVRFAEVIAEPSVSPAPLPATDDDAPEAVLTPDPALAALTDEEAWVALEPEGPHLLAAAGYARQLDSPEHIYRLCQLLVPVLRRIGTPEARAVRRPLLEWGLIAARATKAPGETLLLATQLADLALDDRDFDRAILFADEALMAALARKDLRAIGFATRRVAALAIRQGNAERALETARQAVALARTSGDRAELNESITLLAAATKLNEGQEQHHPNTQQT
jgi:hypothetical protein